MFHTSTIIMLKEFLKNKNLIANKFSILSTQLCNFLKRQYLSFIIFFRVKEFYQSKYINCLFTEKIFFIQSKEFLTIKAFKYS